MKTIVPLLLSLAVLFIFSSASNAATEQPSKYGNPHAIVFAAHIKEHADKNGFDLKALLLNPYEELPDSFYTPLNKLVGDEEFGDIRKQALRDGLTMGSMYTLAGYYHQLKKVYRACNVAAKSKARLSGNKAVDTSKCIHPKHSKAEDLTNTGFAGFSYHYVVNGGKLRNLVFNNVGFEKWLKSRDGRYLKALAKRIESNPKSKDVYLEAALFQSLISRFAPLVHQQLTDALIDSGRTQKGKPSHPYVYIKYLLLVTSSYY